MSKAKNIEELQERYTLGEEHFRTPANDRGREAGKHDVMCFCYADFVQLRELFLKYDDKDPREFTGGEPEIKELHDMFHPQRNEKTLSVKIQRTTDNGNQGSEYKIVVDEAEEPDPLFGIADMNKPRYYKGWFTEVWNVWRQLH